MSLKTDYKDDIINPKWNGECRRTFNIVDSEGNILYENVTLRDTTDYLEVGDSITADTINEQNKFSNMLQRRGYTAFGTCTGQAANQEKVVTIADSNWQLITGAMIFVKFDADNTYSATAAAPIKLNVNNTGAKPVYATNTATFTGTSTTFFGRADYVNQYVYDGSYWVWAGSSMDNNSLYSPQLLGFGWGTCSTAADTAAKAVTLANYNLVTNGIVAVKFTNAVPASATMNINSKGAKAIYHKGAAIKAGIINAGDIALFIYNGSQYHLLTSDTI